MKHLIYSVYDSKADAYMNPFQLPTKGMAIRSFSDAANNPESNISKHPEDYTLFELGTFDDAEAHYDLYLAPKSRGNAVEYITDDIQENQPPLPLQEVK